MEEYVSYFGLPVKIGSGRELYMVSYSRMLEARRCDELERDGNNLNPESYADPDYGFIFRFPFPDEDLLPFGDLRDRPEKRGLIIKLARGDFFPIGSFPKLAYPSITSVKQGIDQEEIENPNNSHPLIFLEIVGQTPIQTEGRKALALVYRCPFSNKLVIVRDWLTAMYMTAQVRKTYIERASDHRSILFWTEIVRRINRGYFDPDARLEPVDLPYLF